MKDDIGICRRRRLSKMRRWAIITKCQSSDNGLKSFLKKCRQGLEALFLFSLLALFRVMPLTWASTTGGFILKSLARHTGRHTRAIRNIRKVYPELSEQQAHVRALKAWETLGRNIAEFPKMRAILSDQTRYTVHGMDVLERATTSQKGVVMLTAHLGNWELVPGLENKGKRVLLFYHPLSNKWLDPWLRRYRLSNLNPGELTEKRDGGLRKAMKALSNGDVVGMLVDLREESGIDLPFLGHNAKTNTAPALMAQRYDAPIIMIACIRRPGCRYEFRIEEIEQATTDDKKADVIETTLRINNAYSSLIRAFPDQWLWSHRRWPKKKKKKQAVTANIP